MPSSKPGWRCVRFSEMVTSAGATRKARGWNADEAGVDHYVGLEHLNSNDLRIHRWGDPRDVGANSDLRHFEPGDVILARRGIELRKVGVPHFRGVASGHALVFRASPDVVLPEFLPFFIQSDVFMKRADRRSVGSLSKTVNLSALLKEEFALPPLGEQERLVGALSRIEDACRAAQDALASAETALRSFLVHTFRPLRGRTDTIPSNWGWELVGTAGDVQLGQQRHPKFKIGTNVRPYLRVANVLDGSIDFSDVLEMHFPENDLSKFELKDGDVLLNEGQSTELVGRSAVYRGELPGCCVQKTLIRFRCGPSLVPGFAQAFFQHCLYTGQFSRMVVQTTSMAHLTAVRFKTMRMPIAPLPEQEAVAQQLQSLRSAQAELVRRRVRLDELKTTFLQKHVEGTA